MQIDIEEVKQNILNKLNVAAAAIPPELYEALAMLLAYMETQRSGMRMVEQTVKAEGRVFFSGAQHAVMYEATVSQHEKTGEKSVQGRMHRGITPWWNNMLGPGKSMTITLSDRTTFRIMLTSRDGDFISVGGDVGTPGMGIPADPNMGEGKSLFHSSPTFGGGR
ncbi:MAG: hypothetical protein ACR2JE_17350 [Acidobacteriaceae bacterium]